MEEFNGIALNCRDKGSHPKKNASGRINNSLIDQQDGNVIPDRVNPPASRTFETFSCVFEGERFFAQRAN
jgi:hypothetical protein